MKIKEIIVVEGRDDTVAVKRAVHADTLETNGSAVDQPLIERIRLAQERRGVIILTDPDYPGQQIRHKISQHVAGCKHAFLAKHEAFPRHKGNIGVEHASPAAIRKALSSVKEELAVEQEEITVQDLLDVGLVGGSKAKKRREHLGDILKIGYTNGKQLHKRLNMFKMTKKEFRDALRQVLQEEENAQRDCYSASNKRDT